MTSPPPDSHGSSSAAAGPASAMWFVPSSNGVDVAVHDFGGTGPLMLFCHATGFCAAVWAPMIDALRDRFRCVALDFRAHGATGLPDGVGLAWTGMAEDLLAVIDDLAPAEPVLAVGHSMGASAIIMAEAARPGTVERAWTFEPILLRKGPVLVGEDGPEIAKAARRRRSHFPSRAEALERYASRPPLSLLDRRALAAYIEHGFGPGADGGVELVCTPEWEAMVFEHHHSGAYERSGEITIPIVIAAGGDDEGPAQWVAEAAAEFPHLTLVPYPGLTHFGPLQEPDRLAVDIARFMGETGTKDA